MYRYHLLIEYVGTNFIGWQIQPKGKSVQKLIQNIISQILKEKTSLVGAGRLDRGVHAIEQSAHFDCKKKINNFDKFLQTINYFVNKEKISILKIKKKKFKFSCKIFCKTTNL